MSVFRVMNVNQQNFEYMLYIHGLSEYHKIPEEVDVCRVEYRKYGSSHSSIVIIPSAVCSRLECSPALFILP